MQAAGQAVPAELQAAVRPGRRGAVRQRPRRLRRPPQAGRHPAPRRSRRRSSSSSTPAACPVLEGYGMTETATVATTSTVEDHKLGTVGRALPGCEVRIADDGEVLITRPAHLRRLLQATTTTSVRRDRRRLAAHRRPRLARRGRLPLDHRPQEGHHHHRGRQEPDAGQPRERPQAVALDLPGRDVRRPPPLPGRADHARPRGDRPLRRASTACPRTRRRSRATRRCAS